MGLLSISGLTLEQWPSLDTSVVAWRHELLSISRFTPERWPSVSTSKVVAGRHGPAINK
jgi:hypothetical protein